MFMLLVGFFSGNACPIYIHIEDNLGNSVSGATILVDNKPMGLTNSSGTLELSLSAGNHIVELSKNGTSKITRTISVLCNDNEHFKFTLDVSNADAKLKEVVVQSKTVKKQIEESPFSVQVVDLKKQYDKAGDVGG